MEEFNIFSFNMHGFNQGKLMVDTLCNVFLKSDVIFLQEHWLTPDKLFELSSISPDYVAHGISAMESEVQTNILVGEEPKGGVCTLINSRFSSSTVNHICAERFCY